MHSDVDVGALQVLDRPEWKAFRQLVAAHKPLRRCGKKLPRICDVNQDRAISITEWLDCLRTPPAGMIPLSRVNGLCCVYASPSQCTL